MRRLPALAILVVAASCGSDDAPTIDAGAGVSSSSTAPSTTSTTATTAPQTIELVLTGDAEAPGPAGAGTATATLAYDGDQLCATGTTDGVGALVAGDVHAGVAGEAGPLVVDLGIVTDGDGPFEGCARVGAEGGVVFVDPASYYLDLHTADLPDGAVRAQLG